MTIFYLFLILFISFANCQKLTDEELSRFPKLYQLDDFEKCLSHKNGLYCIGTFHLTPASQPHPLYDLMKDYSKFKTSYNRTLIHRGYCVSTRCPSEKPERNSSMRFERCVAQWGKSNALRTSLQKLYYCRTHADTHFFQRPDIWQQAFYFTIFAIIALNVIGTVYDVTTGRDSKDSFLMFWSMRSNWKRLFSSYEDGDIRLNALLPLNGGRFLVLLLIPFLHTSALQIHTFVHNPHAFEEMLDRPSATIGVSLTTINQVLILLSSFLTCFNVLLISEKYSVNFKVLPVFILKRTSRIAPLYYLILFYVVTVWPMANDGPLWPILVTTQRDICRRKFWSQIFFVNNYVNKYEHCLTPTWFLAVDTHMCIVSVILTLWIIRQRRHVLKILATLYVLTCICLCATAYVNNWRAPLHDMSTEVIRSLLYKNKSFHELYSSSWTALPACILGVMFGYAQYQNTLKGFKVNEHKWLAVYQYLAVPLVILWLNMMTYMKEFTSPLALALFITIERSVLGILVFTKFYVLFNIDGPLRRFWSWRGWQPLARLSLPIMLVSWCLNVSLVAGRVQPITGSLLDVIVESFGIISISFLLSLPLTILVEMPMGRFLGNLLLMSISPQTVAKNKVTHEN